MSTRTASWLAWSLAGLSVAMAAASVALYPATRSVEPPSSWGTGGDSAVLILLLPFLAFPMVRYAVERVTRHSKRSSTSRSSKPPPATSGGR